MSAIPTFNLIFIHDADSSSKDSKLIITPHFGGQFTWTYKDYSVKHSESATFSVKEAVEVRIETLIDLLAMDNDPIDSVQLEVPGFPLVLFNLENLSYAKDAILRAFRQTAANWPRKDVPIQKVAQRRAPHRAASVISATSSTTCESMPGLVSAAATAGAGNGYNTHWLYHDI